MRWVISDVGLAKVQKKTKHFFQEITNKSIHKWSLHETKKILQIDT